MTRRHPMRWHQEGDGPYVHIDDVIDFFDTLSTEVMKHLGTEAEALSKIFKEMGASWVTVKAEETSARLRAVVNRVDPATITDDLLALRDELADEETP